MKIMIIKIDEDDEDNFLCACKWSFPLVFQKDDRNIHDDGDDDDDDQDPLSVGIFCPLFVRLLLLLLSL